jgi:hypothetical protein
MAPDEGMTEALGMVWRMEGSLRERLSTDKACRHIHGRHGGGVGLRFGVTRGGRPAEGIHGADYGSPSMKRPSGKSKVLTHYGCGRIHNG